MSNFVRYQAVHCKAALIDFLVGSHGIRLASDWDRAQGNAKYLVEETLHLHSDNWLQL